MKYLVGDKIQILSYDKIKKTLNDDEKTELGVYFNPAMANLCGNVYEITSMSFSYDNAGNKKIQYFNVNNPSGDIWVFAPEWCTKIHKSKLPEDLFKI